MRQIIVDTETTGLSPKEGHRIIEIGCVELLNRRITGRRYQQYINPGRDIEGEAQAVHGITQDFLQDKPFFSAVADEFLAFIKGAELIIHNAPFDIGFLDYELSLTGAHSLRLADSFQVTDTLVLARQIHPGQRNSLDALCKRYGVDLSRRELHGALLDANLLAQVYLAMTGGQTSLFDALSVVQPEQSDHGGGLLDTQPCSSASFIAQTPLLVIRADSEELSLHQQKTESMREKGKCLWDRAL